MACACEICGKKRMTGMKVSHSNRKTKRVQRANIQRVKVKLPNGSVTRMHLCTRCIRTGHVQKA